MNLICLTIEKVEVVVFWVVALCSVVVGYQSCGCGTSVFSAEDEGSTVLQLVGIQPPHYTAQEPRKRFVFTAVKTSNPATKKLGEPFANFRSGAGALVER
jgi:hypothetical protein